MRLGTCAKHRPPWPEPGRAPPIPPAPRREHRPRTGHPLHTGGQVRLNNRRSVALAALTVASLVAVAACGDDDDSAGSGTVAVAEGTTATTATGEAPATTTA